MSNESQVAEPHEALKPLIELFSEERPPLTKVGFSEKAQANIYACSTSSITVREDRHRQKFDRKALDTLIDSIREIGQLQPGVCRWNEEDRLELLMGERRLRACTILRQDFQYLITDEVDPLILEQMQLDENLQRDDLTWQEDIRAKARLHAILVERFGEARPGMPGGQRLQDTADHLNTKMVTLQQDVLLASFLEIDEVSAAPNKTTAKKIVKRLIETVKRQETLQTALLEAKASKPPDLTEEERAEVKFKEKEVEKKLISEGVKPEEARAKAQETIQKEFQLKTQPTVAEQQLLYFSKKAILGRMEERLSLFPDQSFDIVCFDPPWGVDFTKNKKESTTTKDYEDDPGTYFENLPIWLSLIYSKMKEDSHLYMFFGIRNHEFVYKTLEEAGFEVHRIPIIWHKIGAHPIRNPEKWPAFSYEPIAFVRKGRKNLVQMGKQDVISTPMPTPSIKDIHPSAKHPQIYKELFLRSANPGDKVLDPMGGSGMFGVAAESLSKSHALDWTMIELDEDFRNLQLLNLMKGYDEIVGEGEASVAKPVARPQLYENFDPLAGHTTFKTMTPGTPQWREWWTTHPEDQQAMLEWRSH